MTTRGGCSPNGGSRLGPSTWHWPQSTTSISPAGSPCRPNRNLSPARHPNCYAREQVKALRRDVATLSRRDRAIILTLLHTGIRRAELAVLQIGDVAATRRKGDLTVRSGKGRRSRTVPLNAECRKAIDAWKADRTRWPIRDDIHVDALWLSRLGNALSSRAIADVVTKAGRAADIPTLSAHTLRHTFVTRLVRNGTDPFMVADLAGHARLDTTLLYSLPTDGDRHSAVEALSP